MDERELDKLREKIALATEKYNRAWERWNKHPESNYLRQKMQAAGEKWLVLNDKYHTMLEEEEV